METTQYPLMTECIDNLWYVYPYNGILIQKKKPIIDTQTNFNESQGTILNKRSYSQKSLTPFIIPFT